MMWSGVQLFLYYDSKPKSVPSLSQLAGMQKIVRLSCIVLLYNGHNINDTYVFISNYKGRGIFPYL